MWSNSFLKKKVLVESFSVLECPRTALVVLTGDPKTMIDPSHFGGFVGESGNKQSTQRLKKLNQYKNMNYAYIQRPFQQNFTY